MHAFAYVRPATVEEAITARRELPSARYMAGGMTLIPALKQREVRPSHVIDIGWLETLKRLDANGTRIDVGALVTHDRLASSSSVQRYIPALAWLAGQLGDPQVRNRGTIGGAIAEPDPAGDMPAALVALDAQVVTDRRTIPSDRFFTGDRGTALESGEMIVRVRFPVPDRSGYARFLEPASQYPLVGVFITEGLAGVRVAVTGAGPSVFRVGALESSLGLRFAPEAIENIAVNARGLRQTIQGSAAYRAHLIGIMAKRAVAAAR